MTIHVVATGDTAQHWPGVGPCIGVNDAFKWGYKIDSLILVNSPGQFQPSRLEVIKKTNPDILYTNMAAVWQRYFLNVTELSPLRRWMTGSPLKKDVYYHSNTSPFVAISLAYCLGYKRIVLWGVDMITHHKYGRGQSGHVQEMFKFNSFLLALKNAGIEVFLGSKGTALDNILPVWTEENSVVMNGGLTKTGGKTK